jgi:hypothetical protein
VLIVEGEGPQNCLALRDFRMPPSPSSSTILDICVALRAAAQLYKYPPALRPKTALLGFTDIVTSPTRTKQIIRNITSFVLVFYNLPREFWNITTKESREIQRSQSLSFYSSQSGK